MSKPSQIIDRASREIAADSNFDAAVSAYLEGVVAWRRRLAGYNKVIASGARQHITKNLLLLHFSNATDNPDNGATFERLLARCNMRDACGPRVLRTVIGLAQRNGHIQVHRGLYDKRLKILKPTEKWLELESDYHVIALSSLAIVSRDAADTADCFTPRMVADIATMRERLLEEPGLLLGEPEGEIRSLIALDGGFATVTAVVDAWQRGKRIPSHKEIGNAFRLSASQARKILRLAADFGLIGFDREGKVSDASALLAACKKLIACEFALYQRYVASTETSQVEHIPVMAPTDAVAPQVAA